MPPTPVVVAEIVEREVTARRSFVGSVEPVRRTTVESEVEGLVTEYLAEEGQRVEAGAPLAKLRTRLVEIRLDAARADLRLRQEELRELRNGSRPEELVQARARTTAARAANGLREWRLERAQQLFSTNVISEDELKEAQLTAQAAKELLAEIEAGLKLTEAGPREERIVQAEARLAAQEAEVHRLEDELDRFTIRAPFAGYVVAEHTEAGAWLGKGTAVADLVALDEVDVVVPVVEDYVLGIKVGLAASVTVGAVPGKSFEGAVAAIVPDADALARTFPVKVRVKNPREGDGPVLKAGMFATVHLPIGATEKALLVPKDALVLGGGGAMVVVVGPEGNIVFVPVETGLAVDALVQVKGQLAAGQSVVVRGNERLRPNQKVRIEGR
jgi:multidrug efflux pump subunit AcrA (membrane-fusion protein)